MKTLFPKASTVCAKQPVELGGKAFHTGAGLCFSTTAADTHFARKMQSRLPQCQPVFFANTAKQPSFHQNGNRVRHFKAVMPSSSHEKPHQISECIKFENNTSDIHTFSL